MKNNNKTEIENSKSEIFKQLTELTSLLAWLSQKNQTANRTLLAIEIKETIEFLHENHELNSEELVAIDAISELIKTKN